MTIKVSKVTAKRGGEQVENNHVLVKGLATWAFVQRPREERKAKTKKGKSFTTPAHYGMELLVTEEDAKQLTERMWTVRKLTKEQVSAIKGVTTETLKTKGITHVVKLKRKYYPATDTMGETTVKVTNNENEPLTSLVGNGSSVVVNCREFEYTDRLSGEDAVSPQLMAVKVLNLVTYSSSGNNTSSLLDNITDDEDNNTTSNEEEDELNF